MKNCEVQRALDAGAAGYLLKSVRWELREPIAMHPGERLQPWLTRRGRVCGAARRRRRTKVERGAEDEPDG